MEQERDRLDESGNGYAIVGSYRNSREAHEAGLVVLACGQPYWVRLEEGRYLLLVVSDQAARMKREIDATSAANRFWPPAPLDLPNRNLSKAPTIVFGLYLVFVFWAQGKRPLLEEVGANSSEAVIGEGEWWRLLTAVSLHADVGHLAGNLMGIALFGYLTCRYMGNGMAWLLILFSASCANLCNAWFNFGSAFVSLGASTAVFAALGLLTGYPLGSWARGSKGRKRRLQNRDWLLPFFGGCVLFAWMGGGDFPVDVTGHLLSFAFGLVFASLAAYLDIASKLGPMWQRGLLAVVVSVTGLCWWLALG